MSDLMDHPFIVAKDKDNEESETKLTVLDADDFNKDMLSVSELHYGSAANK